jgi:wyosine [tRNA(Phe)-imidazoG37] synthetase (radical SAM superfamily)
MGCIFGPVPSRRLGRSLGVDLVPFKTCTFDCLYCQLGRTTHKTLERREWVPLEEVLDELEGKLALKPDHVTLSGSGEPTLYARLGELIDRIRSMTNVPVAVLTNGSLLWQDEVRRQLGAAHRVLPSLDAGHDAMFQTVNRPHEGVTFQGMMEGLIQFREEYRGEYWLEVLLLPQYTATENEVRKIASCVSRIRPGRTQLNTATRPTAEASARPLDLRRLEELATAFDPPAEVVADSRRAPEQGRFCVGREGVLAMVRRRPCSAVDIAEGLGLHVNEVLKYIEALEGDGLLSTQERSGTLFFSGSPEARGADTPR